MRATRSNGRAGGSSTATYGGSHARAAGRDWTAEISLAHGGEPTWSEEDEKTVLTGGSTYATAVRARIQPNDSTANLQVELADETVDVPRYLISVDYGMAEILDGDVVVVSAADEDEALVGRWFRIDRVSLSSERFERDLFCTLLEIR